MTPNGKNDPRYREPVPIKRVCRKTYGYSKRNTSYEKSNKCIKKQAYSFLKFIGGCILFIACLPCVCGVVIKDSR